VNMGMNFLVIYKTDKLLTSCVGFEALIKVVKRISIFWDIKPWSQLKVSQCFGGLCLPSAFTLVSSVAYFSKLKMEATYYSETSTDFQRTL
jgi:hypothetical protein